MTNPYDTNYMMTYVIYHSYQWMELVEQGWFTKDVENDIAIMWKPLTRRG